jgi:hypothetical protein
MDQGRRLSREAVEVEVKNPNRGLCTCCASVVKTSALRPTRSDECKEAPPKIMANKRTANARDHGHEYL